MTIRTTINSSTLLGVTAAAGAIAAALELTTIISTT